MLTLLQKFSLFWALLIVFFVVDMVWLGVIARQFYRDQLGNFLRPDVLWLPAIAFYILFILAIEFFVVLPGVAKQSLLSLLASGAFFGLVTYATYDLTNWATIKDWPATVVFVDLLWGMFLAMVVSAAGWFFVQRVLL